MVSTNLLPVALTLPFAVAPGFDLAAQVNELRHAVSVATVEIRKLQQESEALREVLVPPSSATPLSFADAHAGEPNALIRVRMFGSFEIVGPEGVVRCNLSHKARLLFAYLASQPHKRITKEALTETFWGDCPASRGPNNLSIAVYQIRSWLREVGENQSNAISVQHGSYSFGADGWSIDAVEFSRYITQARGAAARGNTDTVRALMRTAADLYRGDFLAEDAYEDWTAGPRRAYAQEFIGVLRWLMEDAARASDWTTVETQSARATAMDDCDEAAHRWLMVAHWKLGDRAKALFLYRRLRERLKLELGVTPSKQTQEVFRLISD